MTNPRLFLMGIIASAFYMLFSFKASSASEYKNVILISSSTQYDATKVDMLKNTLEKKGYYVDLSYLDQIPSDFGYVNTDISRARTLIRALSDKKADILWFIRGGGGALNLLPYLAANIADIKYAKPKILVGFSDVTALHLFVNQELKWRSVHGVLAGFNKDLPIKENDISSLEPIPLIKDLLEKGIRYKPVVPLNPPAKMGTRGELIGGNLTLVTATFLTQFQPKFTNKILFIEDVGVTVRQLDRTLNQLSLIQNFDVEGIIFGQFYPLSAKDEEKLIYKTVIKEFAKRFPKPVYYYPEIGHGKKNRPLILGDEIAFLCDKEEYCTLEQGKKTL